MFEQFETARRVFVRLLFAHDGFAQKIDSESNLLFVPLAERLHYIVGILSSDELARHAGNIPAQQLAADPRHNFRGADAGSDEWREAVAHVREIFVEMLDDVARTPERRQDIDKAKHLDFKTLIAHRERHQPLVKTGLAEKRFRMAVDQLKNACPALLDFSPERPHGRQ